MKTIPNHEKLIDLVNDARRGRIVLPQFQRNFVWSASDISDLLVSIMQGYYIGTFLLIRTDPDSLPFAARPLEGIDLDQDELRPDYMILDGQQRLTSLHYVFTAPNIPLRWTKYPYRFFLNLRKVAEGELETAVWTERADYAAPWLDRQRQFERMQLPFTEIENWSNWIKDYEWWLRETSRERFDDYWENYRDPWDNMIRSISAFPVTTIELDKIDPEDPDQIAQVCAIFEKMNSAGVSLSVYDLLTARLYKYKIDLHALWEDSMQQYPLLNSYSEGKPDVYGVYLLRTIALLRGLDVKSRSLINLAPAHFERDWKRAAQYMEKALQRLTSTNADGFGVIHPKWMPYSTMVSPMAALLALIDSQKLGHRAYKLLRRWYWSSVFLERYAGSVEATIYRDYQDLMAVMCGEDRIPVVFEQAERLILSNPSYSLLEESRVNATYRGVMCLTALKGAKDFRADDSIEFHTLDDHHIFPKAYLARLRQRDGTPYPSNLVNSIVNRTLISSDTNRRISRMSPSTYTAQLIPAERLTDILESHFIDEDARQAMRDDDFEAFLVQREERLKQEIRRQLTLE